MLQQLKSFTDFAFDKCLHLRIYNFAKMTYIVAIHCTLVGSGSVGGGGGEGGRATRRGGLGGGGGGVGSSTFNIHCPKKYSESAFTNHACHAEQIQRYNCLLSGQDILYTYSVHYKNW